LALAVLAFEVFGAYDSYPNGQEFDFDKCSRLEVTAATPRILIEEDEI